MYSVCDVGYTQERHIPLIEEKIYENCKDKDLDNKHTRRFLGRCSRVLCEKVFQRGIYVVTKELACD